MQMLDKWDSDVENIVSGKISSFKIGLNDKGNLLPYEIEKSRGSTED